MPAFALALCTSSVSPFFTRSVAVSRFFKGRSGAWVKGRTDGDDGDGVWRCRREVRRSGRDARVLEIGRIAMVDWIDGGGGISV